MPGAPLPPLLNIPAAVNDLSTQQVGTELQIGWSAPRLTTEGTRIRDLDRVELYGGFSAQEASVESFKADPRLIATIPAAHIEGPRMIYSMSLKREDLGRKAFFAVRAVAARQRQSALSNIVTVIAADLPLPPQEPKANLTETAVRLSWRAATSSAFGGPAPSGARYRIYRADALTGQAPQEIGSAQTAEYSDTAIQMGQTYTYFIRAASGADASAAISQPSAVVQVKAEDRFPPAPPQDLRAIAVPGAVDLAWSPNNEPDLAGYNVYRGESASGSKLNPTPLTSPTFRDLSAKSGEALMYRVTAVDRSGNESGPSDTVAVTAE